MVVLNTKESWKSRKIGGMIGCDSTEVEVFHVKVSGGAAVRIMLVE